MIPNSMLIFWVDVQVKSVTSLPSFDLSFKKLAQVTFTHAVLRGGGRMFIVLAFYSDDLKLKSLCSLQFLLSNNCLKIKDKEVLENSHFCLKTSTTYVVTQIGRYVGTQDITLYLEAWMINFIPPSLTLHSVSSFLLQTI